MLVNKFLEIKKSAFFYDILHSFFSKGLSLGLGFLVTILITRNFSVEVGAPGLEPGTLRV